MNPVPVVVTAGGGRLRDGGVLADVAPTVLELLGEAQPPEMTGSRSSRGQPARVSRAFTIDARDGSARAGVLHTPTGTWPPRPSCRWPPRPR